MGTVSFALDSRELAADKAAVSAIDFCSLWPTAKPILQQLATVISSSIVKFAINTVISAGDAYCSTGDRLSASGLDVPASVPADVRQVLSTLSDTDLTALADVQRKLAALPNTANDVGNYVF